DALEGVTHSLCSLEYEIHRPLYDWVVEHAANMLVSKPRQIEFARLNMTRTVMSKRYLRQLVEGGYVRGWDDPRMPTLSALRRRGYSGAAIREFVDRIGMSKADSVVDLALLESCVRDDLGDKSPRAMAVLRPLKVEFTNWPEDRVEELTVENHPDHPEMGTRTLHFTKHAFIDADDFMLDPPKKFFRLSPGREVRLKGAYIIKCEDVKTDENGNVTELLCSVDLDSFSGSEGANRKVKGTLHWLSDIDAVKAEVRLYEPLINDEEAETEENQEETEETDAPKGINLNINPDSLTVIDDCLVEPYIAESKTGDTFQFLRTGYFCKDPDSTAEKSVFNRVVPLKDSWAKVSKA
ncbi:MAG: glutamine--tRNA ligase, partial [Clostridia bacterium]|nr:glutamine--tRNA ligase [Clostridia bacterium]